MISRSAFREQVREALLHLYDYERLERSPLGAWLRVQPGHTGKGTLRQTLLEAVEALKPEGPVALRTPAWRTYYILFYRFVQGMTVGEVASQLGFGERHFRRYQARALQLLADTLWEGHIASRGCEPTPAALAPDELQQQADLTANLAWLEREPALQPADLRQVLSGVEAVLSRLASSQGVALRLDLPAGLPPVDVHPLALRQILVSALSYVVGLVPGGQVEMQGTVAGGAIRLLIVPRSPASRAVGVPSPTIDALAVPQQLLAMYGGSLAPLALAGGAPAIAVQVPLSRRLPVLIVDDNADTARLFARFLAESRYQPIVAHGSHEVMALAQEVSPAAIVLDVMMPAQDGWEVLGLLKAHPQTEAIPVVVATILADRELALSLGAAEFLHKPVSQEDLLAALARQVGSRR